VLNPVLPNKKHFHILAVAEVLVAVGRHHLNITNNTNFHDVLGVSLHTKPTHPDVCKESNIAFFEKLLSGHPLLSNYLQLLEDWPVEAAVVGSLAWGRGRWGWGGGRGVGGVRGGGVGRGG
jgi:hypothetical protein